MTNVLSPYKIKKIMIFFCEDIIATKTANLTSINRNTINRYFNLFRKVIAFSSEYEQHFFLGEVELDESYFGAKRVRGKRGRGAAGKIPVFGIITKMNLCDVKIMSITLSLFGLTQKEGFPNSMD